MSSYLPIKEMKIIMMDPNCPPRLMTAMVTPMNDVGKVNYQMAEKLAKRLVRYGSKGIVLAGSTGESPTLSNREKLTLFKVVLNVIGNEATVIAGTSNSNTQESIDFSGRVADMGVDALMLTVPSYNKPQQEGLYQHFKSIAESVSIPCILYNVPSRTGLNMTAETTIRLSAIPNIIGIKEASSDLDQIEEIIFQTDSNFRVWSGNDHETADILYNGGYGVVSVASHLVGKLIEEMIWNCVEKNYFTASSLNAHLLDLFKVLFIESNPVPVKTALRIMDIDVGGTRLPLVPLCSASKEKLRATLYEYEEDIKI
jgi:4-hydroxy-tetrahydrodipicolinate synthase